MVQRRFLNSRPSVVRKPLYAVLDVSWENTFEGWTHKYVRKNWWRIKEHFGSHEDAVQECAYWWARGYNRHKYSIDNPKQFMLYYQRTIFFKTHLWSNLATSKREVETELVGDMCMTESVSSSSEFFAQVAQSSQELKEVLLTIALAPSDFIASMFSGGSRAETNTRIKAMCEIDSSLDMVAELEDLLETTIA